MLRVVCIAGTDSNQLEVALPEAMTALLEEGEEAAAQGASDGGGRSDVPAAANDV